MFVSTMHIIIIIISVIVTVTALMLMALKKKSWKHQEKGNKASLLIWVISGSVDVNTFHKTNYRVESVITDKAWPFPELKFYHM